MQSTGRTVLHNGSAWNVTKLGGVLAVWVEEETGVVALDGDDNRDLDFELELLAEIPERLGLLHLDGVELGLRNAVAVIDNMLRIASLC